MDANKNQDKMKPSHKRPYSFNAGGHTSEKTKKKLTGQTDAPLNTKSNGQSCTTIDSLEEIKHRDVTTYSPMIQNKDVPQAWEVPPTGTTTRKLEAEVLLDSQLVTSVEHKQKEAERLLFSTHSSLHDMKSKSSFEEFTPDISTDGFDNETYRFQCSCPGLYQCSVTGLVFVMKGEGDVVYRTVPWNRRLLSQHHKKPAGPLFDIKCLQQSVCQLHLPHCEIISTGGAQSLQVAHVNDEGIKFISPHQITETHVDINITGFSGFGNVKDEDSPPDPVQALVLLFYKPPDPDLRSFLSVLLLPSNIVIRDVQRTRRELIGEERYIDVPSKCNLHPKQVYTLSTSPEDDLITVQPNETEFDYEYPNTSVTSFQVILKTIIRDINLSLGDQSSSSCVWESEIHLLPNRVRTVSLPPNERLLNVRSSFIEGISGPVLNCLMDKLLEKKVITDAEREEADAKQIKWDRSRFVIDTVRKKGEAASSEMIKSLCELDSYLCRNLELI